MKGHTMPEAFEIRKIMNDTKAELKRKIMDTQDDTTSSVFHDTKVTEIVEDILIDLWTALKPEAKADEEGMQCLFNAFAAIELKYEQVVDELIEQAQMVAEKRARQQ